MISKTDYSFLLSLVYVYVLLNMTLVLGNLCNKVGELYILEKISVKCLAIKCGETASSENVY